MAADDAPSTKQSQPEQKGTNEALPLITTLADVEKHGGQLARIEGCYEVTPVASGKALQPASIVLSDGTRLLRSYRPVAEELRFHERRVVVLGKAYLDANQPGYVQQVMAPHVFPESIELHPSEPPAPELEEIPTPPTASSVQVLRERAGRWVQVVATVLSVKEASDGDMWADVTVRLADGTEVTAPTVPKSRWLPLQGKEVSFQARVLDDIDDGGRYAVSPSMVVCEGRVERCGMGRWRRDDGRK